MSLKLLKVFSVTALVLLTFVALGPATWQPRSGIGWEIDHFVGYFIFTLMFCIAWPRSWSGEPSWSSRCCWRACKLLCRIARPITWRPCTAQAGCWRLLCLLSSSSEHGGGFNQIGRTETARKTRSGDFDGADLASTRLVAPIGLDTAKNFDKAQSIERLLRE